MVAQSFDGHRFMELDNLASWRMGGMSSSLDFKVIHS
jgi:hypothetical protein